jgi:hypothetical protein
MAALVAVMSLTTCTSTAPPVALARYLDGVEVQAETDAQRAILTQALDDMFQQPPATLRAARYGPDQRTLPALLRAHLVPSEPIAVDDEAFYTQAGDPQVRAALGTLLQKLRH